MDKTRFSARLAAALVGCAGLACEDTVTPGTPAHPLSHIAVTYLCGNDFTIQNASFQSIVVRYEVLHTAEAGELLLLAGSDVGASSTRLTTLTRGSLRLSTSDGRTEAIENHALACPLDPLIQPQATVGEWSSPFPWPHVAVHLHLLPSGQVLSWGRQGTPQVYDPASATFRDVPSATNVFCGGHTFLPDGRLLVSGGHQGDRLGLRDANLFDPGSHSWFSVPQMRYARWYPTNTTLPNGEVISLAGTDEAGEDVETPEVWNGSSWRLLTGARRALPYYPRTFVAPNGLVFYAGELAQSAYLDPNGAGSWTPVATSSYGRRDYGSAVMYAPGRVMIVGGSDPPDGQPTRTVELIDLNDPAPSWRYSQPMTHPRRHHNATLLPDGQVLVTGGTRSAGFSDMTGAVHAAELWDPESEQWTLLAENQVSRGYHSTTLLLPDGRVLHAGSGDGPGVSRELSAELFAPPYLFRGDRPILEESPEALSYGQPFLLSTPDAGEIVRVTLVRLSSVTHAFDQSQLFIDLDFRRSAGGLTVTAPESNTAAPPGPYMLAILNSTGVPSVARILKIR